MALDKRPGVELERLDTKCRSALYYYVGLPGVKSKIGAYRRVQRAKKCILGLGQKFVSPDLEKSFGGSKLTARRLLGEYGGRIRE